MDASGISHLGLIPIGIPMLKCSKEQLTELRAKALGKGRNVVDFPKQGQQTKDYSEFLNMMSASKMDRLGYLGIAIFGKKNTVNRMVEHCEMIR